MLSVIGAVRILAESGRSGRDMKQHEASSSGTWIPNVLGAINCADYRYVCTERLRGEGDPVSES